MNDYGSPRIESADMTGDFRRVFVILENPAVSLIIARHSKLRDRLCWVEVNKNHIVQWSDVSWRSPMMAVLKCADISGSHSAKTVTIHRITNDKPFTGLAYFDETFYWSVRNG